MIGRSLILALGALLFGGMSAMAQTPTGRFETPTRAPWAGEIFDLTLAWRVDWATFGNLEGDLAWSSEPLVAEPWGAPSLRDRPQDGAGAATITLSTRAMALAPGEIAFAAAQQDMRLQTGVIDMEEYQRAVTEVRTIESAPGRLTVRPLPPAPPGFTGAVGRFSVRSFVEAPEIRVGEPFTWTVEVSGEGNWPAIRGLPSRQASRDFELAEPAELIESESGDLFERTWSEQVVLIPRRAGVYVLGGFTMPVFDPEQGAYVTLEAEPIRLDIAPGPNGEGTEPAAPGGQASTAEDELPPLLGGQGDASRPWGWSGLALLMAGGLALLLTTWSVLAVRRALALDPHRPARQAHAKLTRLLASPAADRVLVRSWQTLAGLRWKLGQAAPTAESFGDEAWASLWRDADLYLYGRDGVLPPGWLERARASLHALGAPPPFDRRRIFTRQALAPGLAAALALLVLAPSPQAWGADLAELRNRVDAAPRDWRARHDLAVMLAAQDQWAEAAGHAASAYLQQPSHPQTRRTWRLTAQMAGVSLDPRMSPPRPDAGWREAAASRLAPGGWSRLAGVLTGAVGLALMVWLWSVYQGRRRRAVAAPAAGGVAGVALAGALLALAHYGPAAAPDAVIVWDAGPLRQLPVDTPAQIEPVQLAAGALGRSDHGFLGWRRVRLADGEVGWVRQERLIWVWGAPD